MNLRSLIFFSLLLQDAEWTENIQDSCIKIAAIDNGLAFPFKHPDEWRACMFITYFTFAHHLCQ